MTGSPELLVGPPFQGWRAWTLVERRTSAAPVLAGIYLRVPWLPRRPIVAHCVAQWSRSEGRPPPHPSPSVSREACGVYAPTSAAGLEPWLQPGLEDVPATAAAAADSYGVPATPVGDASPHDAASREPRRRGAHRTCNANPPAGGVEGSFRSRSVVAMAYTNKERHHMRLQLRRWIMRACIAGTLLLASGIGGGWKWHAPLW